MNLFESKTHMANNNPKNILLELWQKKEIQQPIFQHSQNAKLEWMSVCFVGNFQTKSAYHMTKSVADCDAASQMLQFVRRKNVISIIKKQEIQEQIEIKKNISSVSDRTPINQTDSNIPDLNSLDSNASNMNYFDLESKIDKKLVVIIDAENTQIDINDIGYPCKAYVFYGYLAALPAKLENSYNEKAIVYKHSLALKESTDHYITFILGQMLAKGEIKKENRIAICSRDTSAAIQVTLLQQNGIECCHITSCESFKKFIRELIDKLLNPDVNFC